jgi:hypothetical protein
VTIPLSSNRAECKALVHTRAGKKNPSSLNSYSPQNDCYSSSRTVATHTARQSPAKHGCTSKRRLYQQEKSVPAREGCTSRRKVVPARGGCTSRRSLYQQEKAVPAGEKLYQQEHQQEKHLTAKAAPAIATRDFKQQPERGLWLAEKDP